MANTNCLEGLQCPRCGHEDDFAIGCYTIATVTDDGIDEYGDMEWNDDSPIWCGSRDGCDPSGTIKEFTVQS